jgi:hypothetical protein
VGECEEEGEGAGCVSEIGVKRKNKMEEGEGIIQVHLPTLSGIIDTWIHVSINELNRNFLVSKQI